MGKHGNGWDFFSWELGKLSERAAKNATDKRNETIMVEE